MPHRRILFLTSLALFVSFLFATQGLAAQEGGILWKDRAKTVIKEDEVNKKSMAPVIISTMAGAVLGIETVVVGVGIAGGSNMSWWTLGGLGGVMGAVAGAYVGMHYFMTDEKEPNEGAQTAPGPTAAPVVPSKSST